VEFFGVGVSQLSLADRATIANMCPEYGATVGYFPIDDLAINYLRQTGKLLQNYFSDLSLNKFFGGGEGQLHCESKNKTPYSC